MRKVLLLICLAFIAVCYAYPCFILPLGAYKSESEILGQKVEVEYRFSFSGKATIKSGDETEEYNYKLKGNKIILSLDDEFDDSDAEMEINSFYELDSILGADATNHIAMYITAGVGVLTLLLVLIPNRK